MTVPLGASVHLASCNGVLDEGPSPCVLTTARVLENKLRKLRGQRRKKRNATDDEAPSKFHALDRMRAPAPSRDEVEQRTLPRRRQKRKKTSDTEYQRARGVCSLEAYWSMGALQENRTYAW